MATVNRVIFEDINNAGGVRRLSYDYDDQTLFLTAVHMLNTTTDIPFPAQATVVKNGRTFSRTEPPGGANATEFVQSIPTGAANRMELFINATNGRLDGISWSIG